jgi:regulator of replication initiation timing
VAPDGVAPDADMKADGEPRTKMKWNDDEWKRWQEKKDASKAESKAKSDEGQWKRATSWGKAQWKSYAPTVPVASEASMPPQGSMPSNPILPEDPLWQSIGDLRQQHVAVHQELSEVQVKIQTLTEEQTKLGGDIAGVNERLAQHQALRTLEKEDVTKLSKFMEEQRDKCKVMDEQLGVAMAKDKEESERHRSRLDELCARCAAQDDRIKVLEAKLAIPSDSSDMKKAMEKK